jgi:hypothetical protein
MKSKTFREAVTMAIDKRALYHRASTETLLCRILYFMVDMGLLATQANGDIQKNKNSYSAKV